MDVVHGGARWLPLVVLLLGVGVASPAAAARARTGRRAHAHSGHRARVTAPAADHAAAAVAAKIARAKALYRDGRIEESLALIDQIRKHSQLDNGQRIELLKYQAFSLFLMSLYTDAKKAWLQLLVLDPTYHLDPVDVSPELVAFFGRVKPRKLPPVAAPVAPGGAKSGPAAAASSAKGSTTTEELQAAPGNLQPPTAPRPPYVKAPVTAPARGCGTLLCLVPFGVGQFANGRYLKGSLFAGAEVALLVANIALYWSRVSSYDQHGYFTNLSAADRSFAAQEVMAGLFAATAVGGVVDAFVFP